MSSATVATSIDRRAQPYNVLRTPKRRLIVGGVYEPASPITIPIRAVVVPIGDDETFEPKGDYSEEGFEVYTRFQLQVSSEQYENDAIVIDGRTYSVLKSSNWGPFFDALVYAVRY